MSKARRFGRLSRLKWPIILAVCLVAGSVAGVALYRARREANTAKLLTRGQEASAQLRWADACVAYRMYLRRKPRDLATLKEYAVALENNKEGFPSTLGPLARVLTQLARNNPRDVSVLSSLTDLYLQIHEFGRGHDSAKAWLELEPDSPNAAIAVAAANRGLGKIKLAIDGLIAAVDRNPKEVSLYPPLIALHAVDLRDFASARAWVDRGLAIAPNNEAIRMAAFSLHEMLGEEEAAEQQLDKAMALSPANLDILLTAARYHLKQGRNDEAARILAQAKKLDPSSPGLLLAQAAWASRKQDTGAIVQAATNMVDHASDSDFALFASAAELFLSVGRTTEADACIEKLSSDTSRSPRITRWIHNLRGMRALLAGDPARTIEELTELTNSAKIGIDTLNLLARAYNEVGDAPSAETVYRRILQLQPSRVQAQLGLARALLRQTRYTEAKAQVARLHPDLPSDRSEAQLVALACDLALSKRSPSDQQIPANLIVQLKSFLKDKPVSLVHARLLAMCLNLANFPDKLMPLIDQRRQDVRIGWVIATALGHFRLRSDEPSRALRLSRDLKRQYPNLPAGFDLSVRALATQGRMDDAIRQASQAPFDDTQRCRLLSIVVWHYRTKKELDQARLALHKAHNTIEDCPMLDLEELRLLDDPSKITELTDRIRKAEGNEGLLWRYEMASAMMRLTSPRESASRVVELLHGCLAKRPGWVEARLMLADARQAQGQTEAAIDALQTAILHRPSLATGPAAIALATDLDQVGRQAQADAVLRRVSQTDPNNIDLLKLQTQRLTRTRHFTKAADVAEQVLAQIPDDMDWQATTALLQLRSGRAARAEEILRSMLKEDPSSPSALWTLAQSLLAQGRPDEAISSVRSAAKKNRLGELWLVLGQVLTKLDRAEEAEKACDRAGSLAEGNAELLGACARFWARLGNRTKQLELARRAVEARGKSQETSLDLAAALLDKGTMEELAEARGILEKRLHDEPSNVVALWLKAKLLLAQRPPDADQAIGLLRKTIRLNDADPTPPKLLAQTLIRLNRHRQAGEVIENALTHWPSDVELLIASAELALHEGRDERAIPPLIRANEISPRNPAIVSLIATTYCNLQAPSQGIILIEDSVSDNDLAVFEISALAQLYEAKGDIRHAALLYAQAANNPNSLPIHEQQLISFYARHGDLGKVARLASERSTTDPEDFESVLVAGQLLCTQTTNPTLRDRGFTLLKDAAKDKPDRSADAYYRMGLCHYAQGAFKQAESKFRQSHNLAPKSPGPVNALAWLYTDKMNKPQEALTLVESFLNADGQATPQLLDTYGTCLLKLKKNAAARTALTSAVEMAGQTETRTAAKYHLALAVKGLGNHGKAMSLLRQALALNDRVGGLSKKDQGQAAALLNKLGTQP